MFGLGLSRQKKAIAEQLPNLANSLADEAFLLLRLGGLDEKQIGVWEPLAYAVWCLEIAVCNTTLSNLDKRVLMTNIRINLSHVLKMSFIAMKTDKEKMSSVLRDAKIIFAERSLQYDKALSEDKISNLKTGDYSGNAAVVRAFLSNFVPCSSDRSRINKEKLSDAMRQTFVSAFTAIHS